MKRCMRSAPQSAHHRGRRWCADLRSGGGARRARGAARHSGGDVGGWQRLDRRGPLAFGWRRWFVLRVVRQLRGIRSGSRHLCRIGNRRSDDTQLEVPAIGTSVVQIDIDPAELGRSYPNTVGVVGDAKSVLRALTCAVEPSTGIQYGSPEHGSWCRSGPRNTNHCGRRTRRRFGRSASARRSRISYRTTRSSFRIPATPPSG